MRTLVLATAALAMAFAAAGAWAQPAVTTPLSQVPFAAYGDARLSPDCDSEPGEAAGTWTGECRFSGDLRGNDFALPLDHAIRLGSEGCTLVLPGAREPAAFACRRLGQQFGSWIEVAEILGTPCRTAGVLWSRVAASTEREQPPPIMHVVQIDLELVIEPGQGNCEAGIWNETRYYLLCGERPDPTLSIVSVNEQVCGAGVELVTFEAVHWKPDSLDEDDPWYRRLYAQVRTSTRGVRK